MIQIRVYTDSFGSTNIHRLKKRVAEAGVRIEPKEVRLLLLSPARRPTEVQYMGPSPTFPFPLVEVVHIRGDMDGAEMDAIAQILQEELKPSSGRGERIPLKEVVFLEAEKIVTLLSEE